jgi:hypothetical protein
MKLLANENFPLTSVKILEKMDTILNISEQITPALLMLK